MKILTIPSNLYAERVYADHPTALWSLDETLDYISLIQEDYRNISDSSKWDVINGSISLITTEPSGYKEQFPSSYLNHVFGDTPSGSSQTVTLTGKSQITTSADSFSIGAHFYINSIYISKIEVGYKDSNNNTHFVEKAFTSEYNSWFFVSGTFSYAGNFYPVIRITYSKSTSPDYYDVLINGLAIGNHAEEFIYSSLGINDQLKIDKSNIGVNVYGLPADAYGLGEENGYYLFGSDKILKAKNSGIPMVFGAYNATTLYPFSGYPSLIIPGKGFLNKKGASSSYCFEAWVKVNTSGVNNYSKIIGPIGSSDGLYVHKQFLVLIIGKKIASHYVGEWGRPMLIQLNYTSADANLIVNGETVISMKIDSSDKDLFPANTANLDWIGFYVQGNISNIQVDCVAIYPYIVSETVAKRRFVYGQAIEYPSILNTAFGGQSMLVDYAVTNFANTYSYPDIGNWKQGISENMTINTKSMSIPNYKLPDFISYEGLSTSDLLSLQDNGQGIKIASLDPQSSLYQKSGYFRISDFGILPSQISAIYARYIYDELSTSEQMLFQIKNVATGDSINCYTVNNFAKIDLIQGNTTTNLDSYSLSGLDESLSILFDIDKAISSYGSVVTNFFASRSQLQIFIAGTPDDSAKTFKGRIGVFGLSSLINKQLIQKSVTFDTDQDAALWAIDSAESDTPPSYGLFKNVINSGLFIFDIKAQSYWEDYVPLAYFQKTVLDASGNTYRTVDFLQFNIDSENVFSADELTYDQTNWNTKASISFIDTTETSRSSASTVFQMPVNGVVTYSSNWKNVSQEVVNSAVIYPPSGIDQDKLGVVIKVNLVSNGITSEPVKTRSIQISSHALNDKLPNSIGTKFGVQVYPYIEGDNDSVDYKSQNPFVVSKTVAPHLYLGKQTGMMSVGDYDINVDRGLMMLINKDSSPKFSLSAMQFCVRSSRKSFPDSDTNIIEIHTSSGAIDIHIKSINASKTRASIKAYMNGQPYENIEFFVNGILTKTPVITIDEWAMIGIAFTVPLNFDSFTGKVKFGGPTVINNLSYYQVSDAQKIMSLRQKEWGLAKYDPATDTTINWSAWQSSTWQSIYVILTPTIVGINPEEIYNIYLGINRSIFDSTGSKTLTLNKYEYTAYKDLTWQSKVVPAV